MSGGVRLYEWRSGELERTGGGASLAEVQTGLPDGGYTTFRTYRSDRVIRIAEHARRLHESTGVALSPETLRRAAAAARADARPLVGAGDARLRITWAPPRLWIAVEAFAPPAAELYERGARCVSVGLHRDRPSAKDTRFIARAGAAYRAFPEGVHEGLLLGPQGEILEGLTSNFLGVRDGVLRTEVSRALPGITRSLVLEAAAGWLRVEQRPVRVAELAGVEEALLTSASRGVLPVVEVDGIAIGDGRPGPRTRELSARFEALVARDAEPLG